MKSCTSQPLPGATHELTKHPAGLNTSVMVVLIGAEGAWA